MVKKEIRERMRRLNRALDSQQRLRASAAIFSAVERLPEFRAARTVAVFAALSDEPATDEVLARWASTRRVVLPRVEGDADRDEIHCFDTEIPVAGSTYYFYRPYIRYFKNE